MTQIAVEAEDPKLWVSRLVVELKDASPNELADALQNAWDKFLEFDEVTQADLFIFLLGQV